jgi:hypothetical protein
MLNKVTSMLIASLKRLKEAAKPSTYTGQVSLITVSSHDVNLLILEYERLSRILQTQHEPTSERHCLEDK